MAVRVVGERYELLREIGKGGMGTVFAGRDLAEDRPCAVKVLRADAGIAEDAKERFEREATAPQRIGHPGLAEVYDAFVDADGRMVLVMELLEGKSLRQLMDEGALLQQQIAVVLAALEPLAAVHAAGFVHRDIKPDNIFVAEQSDGSRVVKLLDFGIARDLSAGTMTQTGIIVGSVDYVSPEQAHSSRSVESTADIFSMGVILYEVCAGARPFQGDGPLQTLGNLATGRFPSLDEAAPGLPKALVDLVHECLAFDPDARPQDAETLRKRLAPLLEGSLSSVRRPRPRNHRRQRSSAVRSSAVRTIAPAPIVHSLRDVAKEGRRAKGLNFVRMVKVLTLAMRDGLELDLDEEDRAFLDQRFLVSRWYPYDRFAWLIRLFHENLMGGTDGAAIRMGRVAAEDLLTSVHAGFVYEGDVQRTFRSVPNTWTRYFDFGQFTIEPTGPTEVTATITGYEFMPRVHELMLIGWGRALVELAGGKVTEHELLAAPSRGDEEWKLRLHWEEEEEED